MKNTIKWGIAAAILLSAGALFAAIPQWWIDRGAVDTNIPPDDYAPVVQGQVKQMAAKAYLEFEAKLGGAGPTIQSMVSAFSEADNDLPANLGQLKTIVAPFYDRLWASGFANVWLSDVQPYGTNALPYPWSASATPPDDYAIANIGQLKYLFSFNLTPLSRMSLIPAGGFQMGNAFSEGDRNEKPVHTVWLDSFYMDQTEVTKALWDKVYTLATAHGYDFSNSGSGKATNHPVQMVNWYDCVKWANARSEIEGLTPCYTIFGYVYRLGEGVPECNWKANGYRLPTEAEWEKAARGGATGHRFPWSDSDEIQHVRASYESRNNEAYDTSRTNGTHPDYREGGTPNTSPVGSFAPNGYGLYDMAGNVYERCWDWYDKNYYLTSPVMNPHGPALGSDRVLRGGYWDYIAYRCRVASRCRSQPGYMSNYIGFRLVRNAQ